MSNTAFKTFTADQLARLEGAVTYPVREWAAYFPCIRPDRLVRDLAAYATHRQVFLARSHLHGFLAAAERPIDQRAPGQADSPRDMAGKAAGNAALAWLVTTWYGLQAKDFKELELVDKQDAAVLPSAVGKLVYDTPYLLGLTGGLTAADVYDEAMHSAMQVVGHNRKHGLDPFIQFDLLPIG